MNTYHVAYNRVPGKTTIKDTVHATSIGKAAAMIEEVMPWDELGNVYGEIFYIIKVSE